MLEVIVLPVFMLAVVGCLILYQQNNNLKQQAKVSEEIIAPTTPKTAPDPVEPKTQEKPDCTQFDIPVYSMCKATEIYFCALMNVYMKNRYAEDLLRWSFLSRQKTAIQSDNVIEVYLADGKVLKIKVPSSAVWGMKQDIKTEEPNETPLQEWVRKNASIIDGKRKKARKANLLSFTLDVSGIADELIADIIKWFTEETMMDAKRKDSTIVVNIQNDYED